jgi:hypothetical protein
MEVFKQKTIQIEAVPEIWRNATCPLIDLHEMLRRPDIESPLFNRT